MRRMLTLSVFLLASTLAFAESYTGRLIDSSCADQQKDQQNQQRMSSCAPTSSTTAFALHTAGKIYKLDAEGNTKAADALKNSANRSKDPNAPTSAEVTATVTGTLEGDTLKVDSIEVR